MSNPITVHRTRMDSVFGTNTTTCRLARELDRAVAALRGKPSITPLRPKKRGHHDR